MGTTNFDIVLQNQGNTVSTDLKHLPLEHAPYLLYSEGNVDKNSKNDVFTFFSIRTGSCFYRCIPVLSEKIFIGSQYGWLATVNNCCEPSLINPITQEEITLPSLTTLSNIRASYNINGSVNGYFYSQDPQYFDWYPFSELHCGLAFQKIVVSSEPSTLSHSFIVAAIVGYPQRIAIARGGQYNWILVEDEQYDDLSFHKDGSIISLTRNGAVHRIKFDDARITVEEIAPCLPNEVVSGHKYIVHDDQGKIFKILRDFTIEDAGVDTIRVRVLKLTTDEEEVKTWSPIKSLGGRAILLGANAFVILSAEEVYGAIKPNCIYFTDEWWDVMTIDTQNDQRDLVMYNLQYDRIDRIICPIEHLFSCWPLPIWFH